MVTRTGPMNCVTDAFWLPPLGGSVKPGYCAKAEAASAAARGARHLNCMHYLSAESIWGEGVPRESLLVSRVPSISDRTVKL